MGSCFSCCKSILCRNKPDIDIINNTNLKLYRSTDDEIYDYITKLNEIV